MSKWHIVLLVPLLVLISGGIVGTMWWNSGDINDSEIEYTPLIASSDADLEGLEAAAVESCKCQRAGGREVDCSKDFVARQSLIEDRIFGDQPRPSLYGYGSACAPVSGESYCFPFSDGDHCIGTGYSVNGASDRNGRSPVLCTSNEAQVVDEAYSATFRMVMAENGLPDRPNWTEMTEEESKNWDDVSRKADIAARTAIDDLIDRIYAGESVTPAGTGGGCTG